MGKTRHKAQHLKKSGIKVRKIVCLALMLVMVATMIPFGQFAAFAEENNDIVTADGVATQQEEQAAVAEESSVQEKAEEPQQPIEPEAQVPIEPEAQESTKPETAQEQGETESTEPEVAEQPEDKTSTVYTNSISGLLWLDVFEDAESGAQHGDGIRQDGEQPLTNYDVSLYQADNKKTPVQTVKTNNEGVYKFENIEPGTYVVGISHIEKDGAEYLLPIAGITKDNQFEDFNEEYTIVYSKEISIGEDTAVVNIDAGMRTPPSITPFALTEYANDETSLRTAVNNVADGGTVYITASFSINKYIDIRNKSITIKSNSGSYTITQLDIGIGSTSSISGCHFLVADVGTLKLENIVLQGIGLTISEGLSYQTNGGVTLYKDSTLILENGVEITKCYGAGSVINVSDSKVIMRGGKISNNMGNQSSGVRLEGNSSSFTMQGGEISNNTGYYSGAIKLEHNSTFTMQGGEIINNTAESGAGALFASGAKDHCPTVVMTAGKIAGNTGTIGGAVYLGSITFTMQGGEISGNKATKGGGIYVYRHGVGGFIMTGGKLINNSSQTNGGAIYEEIYSYSDPADPSKYTHISITGSAVVSGNTAGLGSFGPPSNTGEFSSRAINPFPGTLLNNNDINYERGNYAVRYKANGGTAANGDFFQETNVNTGSTTVFMCTLEQTGFTAPVGKYLAGWNTQANGGGTMYTAQQRITISSGLTLYAIWGDAYAVNYAANNGTGQANYVQYASTGTGSTSVLATTQSTTGFTAPTGKGFSGWNTQADGMGTNYAPGSSVPISGNLTLYAQWKAYYTVTYVANNGTSQADYIQTSSLHTGSGSVTTIENTVGTSNFTAPAGKGFDGWNTRADGLGTNYAANTPITISDNTTLYAKWKDNYSVTYKVNNITGTADSIQTTPVYSGSTNVTLRTQAQAGFNVAAAIEPGKEKFVGWNTEPDGSGTPYAAGQTNVSISESLVLYAQWTSYRYIVSRDDTNVVLGSHDLLSQAVTMCLAGNVPCTITTTSDDTTMGATAIIPGGKIVTLTSDSDGPYTITQRLTTTSDTTQTQRHFNIQGGKLTLANIVLAGTGQTDTTFNGGVYGKGSWTSLTMEAGARIINCNADEGGAVFMESSAIFTMEGGEIFGNTARSSGGGVMLRDGGFAQSTMNDGKIFGNTTYEGGGVRVYKSTFIMNGGEISGNTVLGSGGGISGTHTSAAVTINGGKISGNVAKGLGGGGVIIAYSVTLTMTGGEISGNTALSSGGGVLVYSTGTFVMTDGKISENIAANGGGVYRSFNSHIQMSGGEISGNTANTDGGGIYAEDYNYANPALTTGYPNIKISGAAIVQGNTAGQRYAPPSNHLDFSNTSLRGTHTFDGLLLDNDNMNYKNPHHAIIYKANNGTSDADYIQNTNASGTINVTLKATGEAGFSTPAGQYFLGWATSPTGAVAYYAGQTISINSSRTLYAKWGTGIYHVYKDTGNVFIGAYDKLADAVNVCGVFATDGTYTIVATADDSTLNAAVTIPATKTITLTSDSGNNWTITQNATATGPFDYTQRHLYVQGNLTLENITLSGKGIMGGAFNGGVYLPAGTSVSLTIKDDAVITKCFGYDGGALGAYGGTIIMDGGEIKGNYATHGGGGLAIEKNGTFIMNNGKIVDNESANYGGGVRLGENTVSFTMNGGEISENTTQNGGGIWSNYASITIVDGKINNNIAHDLGGGISLWWTTASIIMSDGEITGNTAGQDGGAIHTMDYNYANPALNTKYSNISITGTADVSGNTATSGAVTPPVNYMDFTLRATNPFNGLLLDNNNINYRNPGYAITYKVNNTTGTADKYQATSVAIGSSGTATLYTQVQAGFDVATAIEPGKEKFVGWNTEPDGSGTPYAVGETISISESIILYAQWEGYRYIVTNDTDGSLIGTYHLLSEATNACLTTDPCTITATEDDTEMGAVAEIAAGKEVTLTSDSGNHWTITQEKELSYGGTAAYVYRHLYVNGALTLKNITLTGKGFASGNNQNGGVHVDGAVSSLKIEDGVVITKCYTLSGAGLFVTNGSTLTINGGEIMDNTAQNYSGIFIQGNSTVTMNGGKISGNVSNQTGGGINVEGSSFTMNGGEISKNIAYYGGGGVMLRNNTSFLMTDGKISENKGMSLSDGGGVKVGDTGRFIMSGGEIINNTSNYGGGGVSVARYNQGAEFTMTGGVITGNKAVTGGAIFSADGQNANPAPVMSSYRNISITGSADVSGNISDRTIPPPSNYASFNTRTPNPFPGELLNNDEINYLNPNYALIYKANNGGIGQQAHYDVVSVTAGSVTRYAAAIGVTGANFIAPAGQVFICWTENEDGTGAMYKPGDPVILVGQKTLYAQWSALCDVSISKTVTGAYADLEKDNTFTLYLQDSAGSPVADTFDYTGDIIAGSGATAPTNGTITTNSSGQATLTLKHGQRITLEGIPADGKVRIVETADANYTATFKDSDDTSATPGNDTGIRNLSGNRSFDFVNTRGVVVPTGISTGSVQGSVTGIVLAVLFGAGLVFMRCIKRSKRYE